MKQIVLVVLVILFSSNCNSVSDKYVEYYPNSNRIKLEGERKYGLFDGEVKNYREDGTLQSITNYLNGRKDGEYIEFFREGSIYQRLNYMDDVLDGVAVEYFPDGNKAMECLFSLGQTIDTVFTYHESGGIKMKIPQKDGKAFGLAEFYNEQGFLYSTEFFINDIPFYTKRFDSLGQEFLLYSPVVLIDTDSDCVNVNKRVGVQIFPEASNADSIQVFIGKLDINNNIIDTHLILPKVSKIAHYSFIPKKTGPDTLSGVVREINSHTGIYIDKYFRFPYYVK